MPRKLCLVLRQLKYFFVEKVERVEALLISLPLERSLHEGVYSKIDQLKRAFDGDQSSPQLNSGGLY